MKKFKTRKKKTEEKTEEKINNNEEKKVDLFFNFVGNLRRKIN
jgi:hypothetical protein